MSYNLPSVAAGLAGAQQADSLDPVAHYRDQTLNDLPEFATLNPSIEHFTRIVCQTIIAGLPVNQLHALQVKIWENEIAWAAYRQEL